MRKSLSLAFVLFVASICHSQPPAGYYASVDQSTPATFRQTVHNVIDDHTKIPYTASTTDTWNVLEAADQDADNPTNVLDLYRNASVPKQGGGNSFYNREHSWPKSYGFPNDDSENYPYTDCHALFLCDSSYNSSRSNKPYRFCTISCTEKPSEENGGAGGGTGVYPGKSNWTSGTFDTGGWETWIDRRGDVARALFYLDVRYEGGSHSITAASEPDLALTDNDALIAASNTGNNESVAHMGLLSVLLSWHQQDPVDDKERRRNDAVFQHQGNRNPFIDNPDWVGCLFGTHCVVNGTVTPPVTGAETWVNEIHYDNSGADAGEFVEVAGPAGTNLNGWSLIGYNGASGAFYRIIALSGTIPDQSNGFGTLAFDFQSLQNGPNDGIAVVHGNDVVEFLSYEGVLTATNGPASGMTSVDVVVSETSSTPVGHSLQRTGAGATSFSWNPGPATRGAINTGQTF